MCVWLGELQRIVSPVPSATLQHVARGVNPPSLNAVELFSEAFASAKERTTDKRRKNKKGWHENKVVTAVATRRATVYEQSVGFVTRQRQMVETVLTEA